MIKIINYTKKPLTLMGEVASTCWNSKPSPRIGIKCIESGHGRVLEYVDVVIEISNYSARMIRELYTSQVGVSKLQESTRYVNYGDFQYYTPPSIIKNKKIQEEYDKAMNYIMKTYKHLLNQGVPKEDIANLLPLGMMTKVILKINARAILHMAQIRLCNRALFEYREFMNEFLHIVSKLDEEWEQIISYAKPKCEIQGYCDEKKSCKKYTSKNQLPHAKAVEFVKSEFS